MRRPTKKEMKRKSEAIKRLIDGVVDETIDIPNDSLVFLDVETLVEVFTKKRLELMRMMDGRKPSSIQLLADITGRKKQAVDRDLKLLEKHELVRLEKQGRRVVPSLEKRFLILGLT